MILNYCIFIFTLYALGSILKMLFKAPDSKSVKKNKR